MHVIVGQGRLDTVLQASPEDRRGFIEEAAGILKHRRRKEKTLRKLDAMEANLTRLSDLAGELRRQLKPLGRQAEIAREAATIAAVVRDAKARLFADELVGLRGELADHARSEQERHAERLVLQDQLDTVRLRIEQLEAEQRSEAVDEARSVRVRARAGAGAGPGSLHARGAATGAARRRDRRRLVRARRCRRRRSTRSAPRSTRSRAGWATHRMPRPRPPATSCVRAPSSTRSTPTSRRRARSSRSTTCASRRSAARPRLRHPPSPPCAPPSSASSALSTRRSRAAAEAEEVLAGIDPDLVPEGSAAEYAAAYERAQREATDTEAEVGGLRERLHAAEREVDALTAQTAALGRALEVRNAAAELVARGGDGIRGLVGDAIKVTPGYEAAIAAVLGPLAEGVLVESRDDAFAMAASARDGDLGVVDIAIAAAGMVRHELAGIAGRRAGARRRDGAGRRARRLSRVVIVDDLAARAGDRSQDAARRGRSTIVTRAGEVVTAHTRAGGFRAGPVPPRARRGAGCRGRAPRRDRRSSPIRSATRSPTACARWTQPRGNAPRTALDDAPRARRRRSRRTPSRSTARPCATRPRSPSASGSPPGSRRPQAAVDDADGSRAGRGGPAHRRARSTAADPRCVGA